MPVSAPHTAYEIPCTADEIRDYLLDHENVVDNVVAIDTETTGLDVRKCELVGISVSASPGTALYIPIAHEVGGHLNLTIVDVIEALIDGIGERECIFWNAKYDLNVLERTTRWIPKRWFDAPILAYLDNSERRIGLKYLAMEILHAKMDKFEEIFDDPAYLAKFGKKKRTKSVPLLVQYLSPLKVLNYAGADADYTLQLYNHFHHLRDFYKGVVKVDNNLVNVLRKLEFRGGMDLNPTYIATETERLSCLADQIQDDIWVEAGAQFDLNSPQQVSNMLYYNLGLPIQEYTATGQPSTDAKSLANLAKDYPIAEKLIIYKKVTKAVGTYFRKLNYLVEQDRRPYFAFNQYGTPTYRFSSSGGDPDKDGTLGINIQAVSNGEVRDTYGVDVTVNDVAHRYLYVLDTEDDRKVCIRSTCKDCLAGCEAKGIDTTRVMQNDVRVVPSVRQGLRAPADMMLLSFDYDRQEIVIAANMSGEKVWLDALKRGEDIHLATAEMIFGSMASKPKQVVDQERKMAKTVNFGILYGMSASGLAGRLGISVPEAEEILKKYFAGLSDLKRWLDRTVLFGFKHGYITTFYKRKRWIDQMVAEQKGHARRVAMNTPIQGTGADVTRIAMVRTHDFLERSYHPNVASMVYTLHDELGVVCATHCVDDVVAGVRRAMEFPIPKWEVQLTTGLKVGRVWGQQLEVNPKQPIFPQLSAAGFQWR